MASLTAADEANLLLASKIPVINGLSGLNFGAAKLLLPAGHAATNGIQPNQAPGKGASISPAELAEYFGVAAPTHCADGWGYLSRALNAYLLGDAHSAWHFAYYAELRAAQSILSSSGCGAFNTWNCVLDHAGNLHAIGNDRNKQTHTMVWLALEFLAGCTSPASSNIAEAMRIFGVSLPDIIQSAYPGITATITSSSWISSWIYDLQTSSADKGFRNRCSYNPHFVTPHRADISEYVNLVTALWQVLEPSPGSIFMELDKHIVRTAIRKAAKESLDLKGISITAIQLESEINNAYAKIVGAVPSFNAIPVEFIKANTIQHPILEHAGDNSSSPATPRPVLARATLLLRIATGMTQNLLRDAGQLANMEFWLDNLAVQQGVVDTHTDIPYDRAELYQDCLYASEDLERNFNAGYVTLASLMNKHDVKPHLFSQTERIVQWSFVT